MGNRGKPEQPAEATRGTRSDGQRRTPTSRETSPFPEGSAWERPGFLLWHATLRWQRIVAGVLSGLDLTHAQFVLLAGTLWLQRHQGPPSQRELADHAGTDEMMTSQVVRTLERRELLVRAQDGRDARIKRLRTTRRGAAMARKAVKLVEAVDDEVFGHAPNEHLMRALHQLASRDAEGRALPPPDEDRGTPQAKDPT